jgi:hypothetical protein
MIKKALLLAGSVALMVSAAGVAATAAQDHAKANLAPVGGSGIHGKVHLRELSSEGARILVQASATSRCTTITPPARRNRTQRMTS